MQEAWKDQLRVSGSQEAGQVHLINTSLREEHKSMWEFRDTQSSSDSSAEGVELL